MKHIHMNCNLNLHATSGRLIVFFVFSIILISCEKTDSEERIDFKGTTFVLESFSKQTIETTLHHGEFFIKHSESDNKKYLLGNGAPGIDIFPADKSLLADIPHELIDTISQNADGLPATKTASTLYVDPAIFSKEEYQLIVAFLKQPVHYQQLIQWLDTFVMGLEKGKQYYVVYAVVYKNIKDLEPQYNSSTSKDWVKVRVNNLVWVNTITTDGLETTSLEDYHLRNDTLFYPEYENIAQVKELLTFKTPGGSPFGSRVKVLQPNKKPGN